MFERNKSDVIITSDAQLAANRMKAFRAQADDILEARTRVPESLTAPEAVSRLLGRLVGRGAVGDHGLGRQLTEVTRAPLFAVASASAPKRKGRR